MTTEDEANARLIAAAPELLDDLKNVTALLTQLLDAKFSNDLLPNLLRGRIAAYETTIAKAEGR